ncbi:class I SAM-dependent methyltransferase [Clostridium sp. AWRP]|uniref:class I SAM-dependent methyltransferase n=1 Tax=Clostridium sp. AWRP TaxID=2212991 RepID=UPI001FA9D9A1|nr:class I SAM-dependent methyltransferase [Clostridium sp. AWRP]
MALEKIAKYWSTQADGYSEINQEELEKEQRAVWLKLIEDNILKGSCLKVLDIGCGPGFFSILMAENGHRVTSIDFSEKMLENAKKNTKKYEVEDRIDFLKMDAQSLTFENESFDLILSRNITWTLENPNQAYKEWLRVLKPGGCFMNFDGNWRMNLYDKNLARLCEEDKKKLVKMGYEVKDDGHGKEQAGDSLNNLPLSNILRPLWDVETLIELGCTNIKILTKLPHNIMNEYYSILYTHMPMFMVRAQKG